MKEGWKEGVKVKGRVGKDGRKKERREGMKKERRNSMKAGRS